MSADATQVTGSPLAGPGVPRPGTVLAERYELLEAVDTDGPAVGFRALDQESERQVLVRILVGPGVHTDVCDDIVRHLRGLVGIGGRYLASLLDADREGRSPFTVEAWPNGTPLSAILDSRRGRGEALGAREALPVIAQLSAALQALPEGLHHGDVRAERVWLDTDGLRLTGAFLLAALPPDELAERVDTLGPGAVAYAPETRKGMTSASSDLWGVGSIAWEALTGRSPDPGAHAPEVQGSLRDALVSLLADEPERRPPDLDGLIRAIARRADLSVPHLDPEPHQPPTAIVSDLDAGGTEPSAEARHATTRSDEDSLDPRLVRAALGVSMDVEDRSGPNDTMKLPSISAAQSASLMDSLDPRLVRAALDVSMDSSSEEETLSSDSGVEGLDPRLVRAALGVEMENSAESIEMDLLDEDEGEDDVTPPPASRPPGAARAAKPAARPIPQPKPAAAFPAPSLKSGLPAPRPRVGGPAAAKPAPRPQPKPGPGKPASRPPTARPPTARPVDAAPRPIPAPRPAAAAAAPAPRPAASPPPGPRLSLAPALRPPTAEAAPARPHRPLGRPRAAADAAARARRRARGRPLSRCRSPRPSPRRGRPLSRCRDRPRRCSPTRPPPRPRGRRWRASKRSRRAPPSSGPSTVARSRRRRRRSPPA
ncbi:MAG: hypothetical protein H6719_31005 [Sandaracinaceae bacterium]|nr:hypothetical protein [Sandaracinaceae bacterium]